ncbi:MAG: N-(5'-phosphoribosyl)anthranilate isomerase [Acidithiobacillales bacterium SG8_45]|jgi:phosphoribosylanthranilate isomerase|nr:MAG: N-(5'-phosphoribosyl)anthranilate isomerase [Acidithiobacillales bacterium SG8_45]
MRIRAKICGITREQDALAAAENGADAIGLVFHKPSPRHISIETAVTIASVVPPFVTRVGLFVDAEVAAIEAVLGSGCVDLLQFHGNESPEDCRRFGLPYIKAVAMREGVILPEIAEHYADAAGLLVDAYVPGMEGGSGQTFDWSRIPASPGKPVILAGGLTPENVAEAIHQVRPYAVDVSSGVESSKGIKDAARIATFMREVNQSI